MLDEARQEAFARLWTEAQPSVSQYIASLISDPASAKDVLQATSLVLLRKFGDYDPEKPFLPWALGMAKFEVLGHRRDAARSKLVFDSDFVDRYTETWAEVSTEISAESSALRHCVKRLPETQRELVRLRYVEELDSQTIGERLGITAVNVRTTLKRVREGLRTCVSKRLRLEEGGLA